VAGEALEHVVEERDAGGDPRPTATVYGQVDCDLRLARLSLDAASSRFAPAGLVP
jgi:hypothetical protein